MAKLVNPGLGDIVDRLTILALKITYGDQAGKDTTHFKTERNALIPQVQVPNRNGLWYEQALQLGGVNAALWQAEDELRAYRQQFEPKDVSNDTLSLVHKAGLCAFRIQALNDERAKLISLINANAGEKGGEEKLT